MRHGPEKYYILSKDKKIEPVTGEILPSAWVKDAAERCKDHTPKRARDYCKAPPAYKAAPYKKDGGKDNGDMMPPDKDKPPKRIFCRLFDEGPDHNPAGLIDLGLAMEVETRTTVDVASVLPPIVTFRTVRVPGEI